MYKLDTFLLFGPECEPAVITLSVNQHTSLRDALAIVSKYELGADGRARAYKQAFNLPASYAVPAWSREAMVMLAEGYEGPHRERVRGLAVCLATDTPFGGPEPGADQGGGEKVPRAPVAPIKPAPGRVRIVSDRERALQAAR